MDGRKNNSGKKGNKGGGRPSKADEFKLIESMDAILLPDEVWENLAELVKAKDVAAIKIWLSYRFGMPKQQTEIKTDGKGISINIIERSND
jgi:hypothetical protein